MLKRIIAVGFALGAMAAAAFAGNVSQLSGPQDPSQLNAVVNTLIVSGNAAWSPTGTSFLATQNISANGSATVSYSTTKGPTGLTPSTVVEWLKIVNPSGAVRLIPMWGCPGC